MVYTHMIQGTLGIFCFPVNLFYHFLPFTVMYFSLCWLEYAHKDRFIFPQYFGVAAMHRMWRVLLSGKVTCRPGADDVTKNNMSGAHTPQGEKVKGMIPAERQQVILTMLEASGTASIIDAAARLGVSRMTIRRDMQALGEQGKLVIVTGGARRIERITAELSQPEKRALHYAEKSAIAARAVDLIQPGMAVFMDAGTTSLAVAEHLALRGDLHPSVLVVSNDFTVCAYLMTHAACRLYHTGGEVLRENLSSGGASAAHVVSRMNLDLAFISSSSWNGEWLSTPSETKVALKVAARKAARRAYLVTDSSKFGKVGLFNILRLAELDGVITDISLPDAARVPLERSGVELLLADPAAARLPL